MNCAQDGVRTIPDFVIGKYTISASSTLSIRNENNIDVSVLSRAWWKGQIKRPSLALKILTTNESIIVSAANTHVS